MDGRRSVSANAAERRLSRERDCGVARGRRPIPKLVGWGSHPKQIAQGATMRSIIIGLIGVLPFIASPVLAADAATQEANKKTVLEFYEAGLNRKDFEVAAKFFGPHYIQHNPTAPDGIEGFKAFLGFLREKFPDSRSEIKRAFADGDYVILHVHSVREKGTRGRAIVDIFRLENGKIVEHWDVVQEIPEKAANTNGMF
jgi:predicted SnoaL-like aldol condensation-catalyzing enzyme